MKRFLLISAILLFPITGAYAGINPFKPYKPLNEIDYRQNWELGFDTLSLAYRPESLTTRSLLPMGLLTTSILFDDYAMDMSIKKQGKLVSPPMNSANYLQYSPAAVMIAIKMAGVEGRSDWPRMITADEISVVLMTSLTRIAKFTIGRERPDGSANNSFPSGHTATAFMCAQMLHKEYGETVSPWISVGGYGLASATGIFRAISNRHWCSDVMCGAAIGIFSTELAYDITDIIFGDKRLCKPVMLPDIDDEPTWKFSLTSNYTIGSDVFTSAGYGNPNAKPACSIGVEGSWIPKYIGPTVYAGLTQMRWDGSEDIYLPDGGSVTDVYTVGAGVELDIPVIQRISLNGQAIAGYSPTANSYSFVDKQNNPLEWTIPAGMHCYANMGMTVRTSAFSSISIHGGLDYYDKVWRSFVMGADFNFTF